MGKILAPGKPFVVRGNKIIPLRRKVKKIFIGVPMGRPLDHLPFESYGKMIAHLARESKYIISAKTTVTAYLDVNRNQIIEAALHYDCDYVLMIDSDMTYPETVLDTLISRDKDVIGVLYFSPRENKERTGTGRIGPLIYDYNPETKLWGEWIECHAKKPFRVNAVGTGIMLIKTEILDKIEQPWFSFFTVKYRKAVEVLGEDIAFCLKCMAAGIEVWVDPTMDIGHCKPYVYMRKHQGPIEDKSKKK